MIRYFSGSVLKALLTLFPDIGLDASKFANLSCIFILFYYKNPTIFIVF